MPMPMPRGEYGMSLWLHSYPETRAGLVVNPDQGKCGAQGSRSLWGATFLGCNGGWSLSMSLTQFPIQPQKNLSFFLLETCPNLSCSCFCEVFLERCSTHQSLNPSPVTQATLWTCVPLLPSPLHLNCTHTPDTLPTNSAYFFIKILD